MKFSFQTNLALITLAIALMAFEALYLSNVEESVKSSCSTHVSTDKSGSVYCDQYMKVVAK